MTGTDAGDPADGGERPLSGMNKRSTSKSEHGFPVSCTLRLNASTNSIRYQMTGRKVTWSVPTKPRPLEVATQQESAPSRSRECGDGWTPDAPSLFRSTSPSRCGLRFFLLVEVGDCELEERQEGDEFARSLDNMSIFSSFSSSMSFNSRISASRVRTRSSRDSV